MTEKRRKLGKKPSSLVEEAAAVGRLLGILGYGHLRTRVVRGAVWVEAGAVDDRQVRLRLRRLGEDRWMAEVRTWNGHWEPIPYAGPRGNLIAWIHQDFPWLLAADAVDPEGG